MRHGPYFIDGFGYREANDEDELAGLADLLSIEGILDEGANRAPPYYTEDLRNGVAALQRREGFEPADGDVRRGSAMHAVLNELAAGVPRGAFIHDDDGSALDSAVGDGVASDPAAVRKLSNRLAALGHGPRFPDGREPYFVKPYLIQGLGDFQESLGLTRTGAVAPDDDTDRALRHAIADLKRANDGAYRAAQDRLAANKAADEARRRAKADDAAGDALPRAELASFGAEDFSGYGAAADREEPERKNAPDRDAAPPYVPPDAYIELDAPARAPDDATKPASEAEAAAAVPGDTGFRPDEADGFRLAPDHLPPPSKPDDEREGIEPAQHRDDKDSAATGPNKSPLSPEERRAREKRALERWLEFRRNNPDAIRGFSRPKEAEAVSEAIKAEGVLSGAMAAFLYRALGSPDKATQVAAARAIAEAARLDPDEARGRFFGKAIEFAQEIDRLARDPALAGDPDALLEAARKNGFVNGHAESLLPFFFFAPSGRGRPGGAQIPPRGPKIESSRPYPPDLAKRLDNIKDETVRGAVGRLLNGGTAEKLKFHDKSDYVVVKSGGNEAGLREFRAAVHNIGGPNARIENIEGKMHQRYTAPDGTRIVFRQISERQLTTNEIHVEPATKGFADTIRLKVRYD